MAWGSIDPTSHVYSLPASYVVASLHCADEDEWTVTSDKISSAWMTETAFVVEDFDALLTEVEESGAG